MKKILIMGLPGSGKTTLAQELVNKLGTQCLWFNADEIREKYNDWDFSLEGRLRQAQRMSDLAADSDVDYVICDFVAPLKEMRSIFNADYTVWVDTIKEGRFEDTNKVFEAPDLTDALYIHVIEQDCKKWADVIIKILEK